MTIPYAEVEHIRARLPRGFQDGARYARARVCVQLLNSRIVRLEVWLEARDRYDLCSSLIEICELSADMVDRIGKLLRMEIGPLDDSAQERNFNYGQMLQLFGHDSSAKCRTLNWRAYWTEARNKVIEAICIGSENVSMSPGAALLCVQQRLEHTV